MRRKQMLLVVVCIVAFASVASADVQADWNAAVNASKPLHWYKFDETPGKDCQDSGTGGLSGKYTDVLPGQQGFFGPASAAVFNRTSGSNVGFSGATNLAGVWTVEYVVKTTKAPAGNDSQALHDSDTTSIRLAGWTSLGEVGFTAYGVADYQFTPGAGRTLADLVAPQDQWVHLVWRSNASGTQLFWNGELAGTNTSRIDLPRLRIGAHGAGPADMFQGVLDEAVVYDRALTDKDIAAHARVVGLAPVKARNPSPANGATGVAQAVMVQWKSGSSAQWHYIYIGTTPDLGQADFKVKQVQTKQMYYCSGLEPATTYYWRIDEVEADGKTTWTGDVWSFTTAPLAAYAPVPANGAKYQDPNVDLAWSAGQDAFSHEIYFSTNQDDVVNGAEAAFHGSQADTTLVLPLLPLETTYYWRVDEIDSLDEKHVGDVWSFTTTIPGLGNAKRELWLNDGAGTAVSDLTNDSRYPGSPSEVNDMPDFESPADIGDNYGGKLSAWLYVPVAGQYTFWVASDDNSQLFLGADPDSAEMIAAVNDWTNAEEWDKLPTQKSKSITLEAGRYYLMALWKDGTGGDNCAAAWQGTGIPNRELIHGSYLMPFEALWAYGPRPRNNDVNTPQILELKWTAGTKATAHQIYFSDEEDAVVNGDPGGRAYRGQQSVDSTTFDPGALEFGKTYYWRVDEISTTDSASPWKGTVWKFTTANFIVVDSFEDYTDDVTGRIFQTWIDGWGYTEPAPGDPGNGTGSTVGYTNPPFAEHTIVHGGRQSMPLAYNNADSPYYSETSRTFDSPQNWTLNGMNTLSLQVRGYPEVNNVSVTETGGKMTLTGDGTDIWNASDDFTYAYKSLNGDATIVARVVSNGTGTNTWTKGGVMIRDSLDGNSMFANMVITGGGGNGGAFQNRATTGLDMSANDATSNTNSTGVIAPPYWVKLERVGDTFNGYTSPDGVSWTIVASTDIVMTSPVYIGICVTSGASPAQRTFEFEGIKTTGNVTGAWQGAVISSPQYNSPQNLYVAVQDSAGKLAVVTDASAVTSATWTEVQMPLSSFTGVSMTKVKKLFIGVGDRNSPTADGTGMLFIDDIRVIKP